MPSWADEWSKAHTSTRCSPHTVQLASAALDAPITTIFELQDHSVIQMHAEVGWPGGVVADAIPMSPDSQAAFVIASSTGVVVVNDYELETRFTPAALLTSRGVQSTASVRIGSRAAPYGILSVHSTESHHFASDDVAFLEELAHVLFLVVERQRHASELTFQALHDPLTLLPNRRYFTDRLQASPENSALLLVDVDHFKVINDTFGHDAGDAVLRAVADRLQTFAGPGDTVARLGGDEFALLVAEARFDEEIENLATMIVEKMSEPVAFDERRLQLSVSVGATPPGDHSTLVRNADVALYSAKQRGRSRSELFDTTLHEALLHRVELRDRLIVAVARGELGVAYQPVIDLRTGRVRSLEALARWNDPVVGHIPPEVFIGLAEDSGVIGELGKLMLEKAGRDLRRWRDHHPKLDLRMAVNVSPRQLTDPALITHVRQVLAANRLEPGALILEITETAFNIQDSGSRAAGRPPGVGGWGSRSTTSAPPSRASRGCTSCRWTP